MLASYNVLSSPTIAAALCSSGLDVLVLMSPDASFADRHLQSHQIFSKTLDVDPELGFATSDKLVELPLSSSSSTASNTDSLIVK